MALILHGFLNSLTHLYLCPVKYKSKTNRSRTYTTDAGPRSGRPMPDPRWYLACLVSDVPSASDSEKLDERAKTKPFPEISAWVFATLIIARGRARI